MNKSILQRSRAFYKVNPTFDACPSCRGSSTLMRSHSRNLEEKFISKLFFYKYYRCKNADEGVIKNNCFYRFLVTGDVVVHTTCVSCGIYYLPDSKKVIITI